MDKMIFMVFTRTFILIFKVLSKSASNVVLGIVRTMTDHNIRPRID
uniref:Uncharacterized protein n=1 Tax=Lepeophtheirus salmonis TaxID=72036 RepID=A0A0K2TVD3_LEPSM